MQNYCTSLEKFDITLLISFQRGTNEIKKYLRSRITEPEPSRPGSGNQKGVKSHQGSSGIIGGGDDKVDAHEVNITKALDYR